MEFGELTFEVVRIEKVGQEALARAENFVVARVACNMSVSLWPMVEIGLRQGARIILRSGEQA
jgi:hypothetical protein